MMRFVQVGVGPLGRRILAEAIERGVGHAVGVVDRDPALVGKSVASIVPNADPRLTIVASLDDLHDWAAVDAAIVTTSSDLATCADTFRTLLEHGKAVVSTCEELLYPWLRHVALAEELDDLAKRHGGRLLGTGVNPGFLMDTLPVVLSGVCKGLRRVTVQRFQDASTRRIPFQQKIGAGLDDDAFAARVREGTLRHVGLGESLHFIAHFVSLPIERWEEDIAPVHAERDLPSALGPIAKGRVAGVRQTARGYHDDQCVVHLEFQAAIGQHDPVDRVVIDAEPRLEVSIPGGVHGDTATCAIAVNALPRIIEAAPGLHTMASIGAIRHAAPSNGHLSPRRT